MNTLAGTQENTIALAIVVIANWLIHNLANDWSLPPEVQSALQSLITILVGEILKARHERKAAKQQAVMARVLGDPPPSKPPPTSPDPAPLAKAA